MSRLRVLEQLIAADNLSKEAKVKLLIRLLYYLENKQ